MDLFNNTAGVSSLLMSSYRVAVLAGTFALVRVRPSLLEVGNQCAACALLAFLP